MDERGLKQGDVIKRSGLAKQTVGEIQGNTKQRNRGRPTLEALSVALDWHPDHLAAVRDGRTPPEAGTPYARSVDDIPTRFDILEHRLDMMLDELNASIEKRFSELTKEVRAAVQQSNVRFRPPGR
jgi:hypothetical protein